MRSKLLTTLVIVTFLAIAPTVVASTTWYVNGVTGRDSNNCKSPTTACKTIKHAISLATSGDSILVAATTYKENLTIGKSLNVIGSGAATTIIDGGGLNTVISISNANAHVGLSKLTIQNGSGPFASCGGGIRNAGTLAINNTTITGNHNKTFSGGGGICNVGILAITNSSIRANVAQDNNGGGGIFNTGRMTMSNSSVTGNQAIGNIEAISKGGGISSFGQLTISDSTISGNSVNIGNGGGLAYEALTATAIINNSTVSNNSVNVFYSGGGGIQSDGPALIINNTTISGNSGAAGRGGIASTSTSLVKVQNSIVANNMGGNCSGTITSNGYNLSSDDSCNFHGPGDMNDSNPMLGPLQDNGGPTKTQALLAGSPAIDSGNPSGCTDGNGHLLKTDQRGMPRPDKEDSGSCDRGAYERQTD